MVELRNKLEHKKFDLVIIKDDGIGDYVIWNDTLRAFRDSYKGKRVLFICSKAVKQFADNEPFFNEVYAIDDNKIKGSFYALKSFLKEIHAIKTKRLVYPCWSRHFWGEICSFLIHADEKIGFKRNPTDYRSWWHYIANFFCERIYDKLVVYKETSYEILANEFFTKEVIDSSYKYLGRKISVPNYETSYSERYIVFAISSSKNYKTWPPLRFARIADELSQDYLIILTGAGKEDEDRASLICKSVKNPQRIINLIGKSSLIQLLSLISKAYFVIGNDSAAVHMAAASHVPSICIFHQACPNVFLPYPEGLPFSKYSPRIVYSNHNCPNKGCKFNCTKYVGGLVECIDSITVKQVYDEIQKLIKELDESVAAM